MWQHPSSLEVWIAGLALEMLPRPAPRLTSQLCTDTISISGRSASLKHGVLKSEMNLQAPSRTDILLLF